MLRFAPRILVLLLCGTALAACATAPGANGPGAKLSARGTKGPAVDLDGNVRLAQSQRRAGQYDEAIHTLSQLMMVAADDPRVVSEYGKALAQKGRAREATQFLTRAIELSPRDWTLYSAIGVAYDQLGNQDEARTAYEHALTLHPDEPSVLNNYALSRMLADDPKGAQALMARAESAGGAADSKIARNIAMIEALTPEDAPRVAAAKTPATAAQPQREAKTSTGASTQAKAQAAARTLMTNQPLALPGGAPRPLQPAPQFQPAPPRVAQRPPQAPYPTVVMQRVPDDPLAGPVKPRVAARKTGTKAAHTAPKAEAPAKAIAKNQAVPALRMAADARNP